MRFVKFSPRPDFTTKTLTQPGIYFFSARPSQRAKAANEKPCINTDITTIKLIRTQISPASLMPAANGKVANTIGTEPRRPTQETSSFSLKLNLGPEQTDEAIPLCRLLVRLRALLSQRRTRVT